MGSLTMPQTLSDALSVQALQRWVREFAQLVEENKDHLTQLDAAIGDADHGTNMDRGLSAVTAALAGTTPPTAGALFKEVGMTLVRTVGGASGPLFGTFFLRVGTSLAERNEVLPADFAAALRAGLDGVVARGKADPGDKTMYDALAPAIDALDAALAAGEPLADALRRAHAAAEEGRDKTIPMLARKGRASYLGERSVGHQDPGATTVALLLRAAADAAAAPSG
jgi:dihydroxyacetone kinase-like protein